MATETAARRAEQAAAIAGQAPPELPTTYLTASHDGDGKHWRVARGEVERFALERKVPAAVVGYDLTFSAPKSVSILWARADAAGRAQIRRSRDGGHQRHWRVKNAATGEAYSILPGTHDGSATAYGVGDLWVTRYKANEIDDGQGFTTVPASSQAHFDKFLQPPEPVEGTDVVVWYAGHYVHDAGVEIGNYIAPDLAPSGW